VFILVLLMLSRGYIRPEGAKADKTDLSLRILVHNRSVQHHELRDLVQGIFPRSRVFRVFRVFSGRQISFSIKVWLKNKNQSLVFIFLSKSDVFFLSRVWLKNKIQSLVEIF